MDTIGMFCTVFQANDRAREIEEEAVAKIG